MPARRTSHMSFQPCIDALAMKRVRTIIEDSHRLPLLNHILTNRTGIILGTKCHSDRSCLLQLLLCGVDNNGLVQKRLQIRHNRFTHYSTNECGKKASRSIVRLNRNGLHSSRVSKRIEWVAIIRRGSADSNRMTGTDSNRMTSTDSNGSNRRIRNRSV